MHGDHQTGCGTHTHTLAHTHIRTHLLTHTRKHHHARTNHHVCTRQTHTHKQASAFGHTLTHVDTSDAHTNTHTNAHTNTHINTHTPTHTLGNLKRPQFPSFRNWQRSLYSARFVFQKRTRTNRSTCSGCCTRRSATTKSHSRCEQCVCERVCVCVCVFLCVLCFCVCVCK